MKFHDVLEEVFGTPERIKILRVLVSYPKEFTSRELSAHTGVSVRGVIDILSLFERHGFVKSRRVGKSIVWRIDREHCLVKSLIEPVFEAEKNLMHVLKREISAILRKYSVQKAIVYGSIARGDERPDSDLDLALLVKRKGKWVEQLKAELRDRVLRRFGNTLSILVYTTAEFKKAKGALKKEIESGVVMFGD